MSKLSNCSCGGKPEVVKLFPSKRYDCFIRCASCGKETKAYVSKQSAVREWEKEVNNGSN